MATRTDTAPAPADLAHPLRTDRDLDPLLDRIDDRHYVCIGEASHGTHEFYKWRARLTRRLVAEKGFTFVAVEGDWPDCYSVSSCVTGAESAPQDPLTVLGDFDRWPTWMWANHEVLGFTRWLQDWNQQRPEPTRVGFYGLDVYSLWESLRAVLDYLEEHRPDAVGAAMEAWRCFEPDQLVDHHGDSGDDVKAVVWEHNTHVGDARFTDMADAGMVNVGQLVRERHGEDDVVMVGFGAYDGTVIAAEEWGAPTQEMKLPAARKGSTEALLHKELGAGGRALFVWPDSPAGWLVDDRAHRAVGVVHRPWAERWGNYVPTVLGRRYDAFLWFDRARGLEPLHGVQAHGEELGTWPAGG